MLQKKIHKNKKKKKNLEKKTQESHNKVNNHSKTLLKKRKPVFSRCS